MILTTHALAGAVIGKLIPSPWVIVPVSLVIHFAMDHLRHGEYAESFDKRTSFRNTWWKVSLDLFLFGMLFLLLLYSKNLDLAVIRNMAIGIFFSSLPDGITLLYWKFKFKWLSPVLKFHSFVHKYPHFAKERNWTFRNAWNDILISSLAILILFLF